MSDMTKQAIWLLSLAVLFVGHTQLTHADPASWQLGWCDSWCSGNNRIHECEFWDSDGHSACDMGECYFQMDCCEQDVALAGDAADELCGGLAWGTEGHGTHWGYLLTCDSTLHHQLTSCAERYYRQVSYATMYCSYTDTVACP